MLARLTRMTSNKSKFEWTKVEQDSFKKNKLTVAHNTLIPYPDFNETFKVRTDAGVFQLGAGISRKGKLINLFSKNLLMPNNGTQ